MSNFYVHNLGCKVNKVESDTISRQLLAAGAQGAKANLADVIVVNTCTVTGEADSKSRKAVHKFVAAKHQPWVIVTGCGAVVNAQQFANLGEKVLVLANKTEAAKRAIALLQGAELQSSANSAAALNFNTRVSIKVQDGCDNRCTYCIVPQARGAAKSVPAQQVLEQVRSFVSTGTHEIVLTGIDLGKYREQAGVQSGVQAGFQSGAQPGVQAGVQSGAQPGVQPGAQPCVQPDVQSGAQPGVQAGVQSGAQPCAQPGGQPGAQPDVQSHAQPYGQSGNLAGLLRQLLQLNPSYRIRLSSIEPQSISGELLELIKKSEGRICAHLHIPLQSGSDRILKMMQRKYDSDKFLGIIQKVQKLLPNIAISTDVIVGFPGETPVDFRQTLDICQQVGFMQMHVFKYSKRVGTKAAQMPNQVPSAVATERSKQLRELASHLKAQDAQARIGKQELVLVETSTRGRSESYYPVKLSGCPKKGELLPMVITGYSDGSLTV